MKKLSYENFIKAQEYIFTFSDDINRAWFRYNFEDSNTDAFSLRIYPISISVLFRHGP